MLRQDSSFLILKKDWVTNVQKAEIISILSRAAKIYEENFNSKKVLIVYGVLNSPSYFEIDASAKNFLHLTGLKVNTSYVLRDASEENRNASEVFFEKALHGRLVFDDFEIKNESTEEKLAVIETALNISSDNRKVGNLNKLHKDLECDMLVGNFLTCIGLKNVDGKYVPNSILKSSISDETCNRFTSVFAILNKGKGEEFYNNIIFAGKDIDIAILLDKLKEEVSISPDLIAQTSSSIDRAGITVKNTLNELKKLRQECIKGNSSAKKAKARNIYKAKREIFKNRDIFTVEMLRDTVNELEKRVKTAKEAACEIMNDDIVFINNEIISRTKDLEKATSVLNQIISPTDVLSSASSALADDSDCSSSKNVLNFSFIPQNNQQIWGGNLHFSGQAAETIALSPSTFYTPILNIGKIATALETLNVKITEFLHNITDRFKQSHNQAQEQPSQAHKPSLRKINYNIPFAKQTPSDERSEPSAAKPERRSSWIDKMLSSAKREADENNSKHEIKSHDKDKSL